MLNDRERRRQDGAGHQYVACYDVAQALVAVDRAHQQEVAAVAEAKWNGVL